MDNNARINEPVRLYYLDNLRVLMVFLVVALHAALIYMSFAPDWWYVRDPGKHVVWLAFFQSFAESFPMTVLFFLAGYFAPPSRLRRDRKSFIKNKVFHIFIPWLLGVCFFAPLLVERKWMNMGNAMPDSLYTFYTKIFLGPYFEQGPYWFLMHLFVFFLFFSMIPAEKIQMHKEPAPLRPLFIVSVILICSAASFLSGKYFMPFAAWVNIPPAFSFHPARVTGYIMMFALGIKAWRNKWLQPGNWQPDIKVWAPVWIISEIVFNLCRFCLYVELPGHSTIYPDAAKLLYAVSYNTASITAVFCLIPMAGKIKNSGSKIWRALSESSFGLYWVHLELQLQIAALLIPLAIPASLKFIIVTAATIIIGHYLVIYVIKKIPGANKIF
jgi:surface polysaccharide O-acyltransferase-like enzyme